MIAIIYIVVGVVYLILSVALIKQVVKGAKKRGIAGWKWGLPTALFMYFIVFWDYIPTISSHKYLCSKYAGFTLHKTLDVWIADNNIKHNDLIPFSYSLDLMPSMVTKYGYVTKINNRLSRDFKKTKYEYIPITKITKTIFDSVTATVLAEDIDYQSGYGNMMTANDWQAVKLWIYEKSCFSVEERKLDRGLVAFTNTIIEYNNVEE